MSISTEFAMSAEFWNFVTRIVMQEFFLSDRMIDAVMENYDEFSEKQAVIYQDNFPEDSVTVIGRAVCAHAFKHEELSENPMGAIQVRDPTVRSAESPDGELQRTGGQK
jgi:hypothetical protein